MVILSLSGSLTAVGSDSDSFYFAGQGGLEFVEKRNLKSYGYATVTSGFSSVFTGDTSFIYLGSDTGLYFIERPVDKYYGQDLSNKVYQDTRSSWLDSERIYSVGGVDRNYLVVGTEDGVEIIHAVYGHLKSTAYSPVTEVHLTSRGDLLYGGSFGLAVKQGPITSSWVNPDRLVTTPFIPDNNINSIDSVTEGEDTVIGIATNDGIMLIQQRVPLSVSPTTKFFTEFNHG